MFYTVNGNINGNGFTGNGNLFVILKIQSVIYVYRVLKKDWARNGKEFVSMFQKYFMLHNLLYVLRLFA